MNINDRLVFTCVIGYWLTTPAHAQVLAAGCYHALLALEDRRSSCSAFFFLYSLSSFNSLSSAFRFSSSLPIRTSVSSPLLLPPPDSLLEADDNETAVLCAPPLSPTCAPPLPRLTVGPAGVGKRDPCCLCLCRGRTLVVCLRSCHLCPRAALVYCCSEDPLY